MTFFRDIVVKNNCKKSSFFSFFIFVSLGISFLLICLFYENFYKEKVEEYICQKEKILILY